MVTYPLTEDRFRQIIGEVAIRRAEHAASDSTSS
jgi:hypothetical protein